MESKGKQTSLESIDLNHPGDETIQDSVVPGHIKERSDKKREESKPLPPRRTYKDLLLRENDWLKNTIDQLDARRYGCRCAMERLGERIRHLSRRREYVLKELERLGF